MSSCARSRSARLAVLLVAPLLLLPLALPAQQPMVGARHVHAIVEDGSTGIGITGAEVAVVWTEEGRELSRRARSDRHGHVDVRDLPARRVSVRVRMLGYAPLERPVDLSADDALLKLRLDRVVLQLSEVSVVADSLVDPLERVSAISTLDRAALDATRGQTLGETIKQLPGVAVVQLGPSIAKPVIRGLNSQRVLVLNGGVRQEDQQWGTEHAPNIDGFDGDAVTVVRGAGTVLYGPDAIGGVIRVDHAAVVDTGRARGDVSLNLFSNSRQGALSAAVQGGDLTLPGIGRTGYRVRLTSRVAGNGQAPDYALANTGFRELNGSAVLGVVRDWGRSEVSVSRFATELGVLRQAHAGSFEDLERAMQSAPTDSAFTYEIGRPNQQVAHTSARWRTTRVLADAGELEVLYGFQYNHRREYDNHGPLRFRDVPAFHLKLFTNSLDLRWRHAPIQGLLGTIGVSTMAQGNQTLGKGFLIPGFDLRQGAVFAQEEWGRGRLSVSGGARVDLISQTTIAFDDAGIRSPAGTRRWSGFAGSLGAAYQVTGGVEASLRVARAWRPPTVNERYAQGVHHGSAQYELGNAANDAERSLGVEGTLRASGRRGTLEIAAYRNVIDGFIYLSPRAPVFTLRGAFPAYEYAQTDALMRGIELSGTLDVTRAFSFMGTGTVVRGTRRADGEPLFDMPADRAMLQARLHGDARRLGAWHAGAGMLLVRRQDGVPLATVYQLPTRGYSLLQLEVGARAIRVAGRPLEVSMSVSNALNARYRDYLSRYRLFVDDAARDVVLRVRAPLW